MTEIWNTFISEIDGAQFKVSEEDKTQSKAFYRDAL
jgi:hypothetical protein